MNIIFNKNSGKILDAISKDQNYKVWYQDWGSDFIDNLSSLVVDKVPEPIYQYYVLDGVVMKYTDIEINEIETYGEILTNERKLLLQLIPSYEDIKQAETTIEILSLLSEVL